MEVPRHPDIRARMAELQAAHPPMLEAAQAMADSHADERELKRRQWHERPSFVAMFVWAALSPPFTSSVVYWVVLAILAVISAVLTYRTDCQRRKMRTGLDALNAAVDGLLPPRQA